MKALQWDCMTIEQRYAFFKMFDFTDVEGGPAHWVDRSYPELPAEVRAVLRLIRGYRS